MNKRQHGILVGLSLFAVLDLVTVRIPLPLLRRRWASFPGLPFLEWWEVVSAALLMVGAGALVLWLASDNFGKDVPLLRKSIYVLLLLVGLAGLSRFVWPHVVWVDSARHLFAVVVVAAIAADALLYGTTLARAGVGLAAVALLCSTLYRAIVVYLPVGASARWLAIASETASLLVPWVLAVTVTRRRRDDLIAIGGAAVSVLLSAVAIWGVPPAAHLLVAQALGFRFSLPPAVHVLTVGASAYVLIETFRSRVIPPRVPWVYLWLMVCGIQMSRPYVQMGALAALAVFAWTPPLLLPSEFRRRISLSTPEEEPVNDAGTGRQSEETTTPK